MYTISTSKKELEKNESLCREAFKVYLTQNVANQCLNTIDIFCKSLAKNTKIENYSYNHIKAMATLQTGYLLGSASASAIANWISPHLEVPPPTTEKKKETAQKQMTESECLYQKKPKGTLSFRYNATQKRCYVKECKNLYVKSSDHSICIFKAEEVCLAKNQETRENKIKNIASWGYGQDLRESPDCYIASCISGYSPNTYGTNCEKNPEPVVETAEKKKEIKVFGVGGDNDPNHSYKNSGSKDPYSDNANVANSYSFRGKSRNVYFTKNSISSSSIPDGSPFQSSYISSMYGMRKLSWEKNWRPHKGIDLSCTRGTPIYATGNGKVIRTMKKYKSGCGFSVKIQHDDGKTTSRYCHMVGGSVKVGHGNRVSRGTILGKCGSTGNSSGPHLHYEITKGGYMKNPIFYLTGGRKP
ncbi:MAG: M23 family metallopeptidase [Alphaproteobacteria bacterium]